MAQPTRILHLIDSGGPGGAETILDTVEGGLSPGLWKSRVVVGFEDWLSSRLEERGVEFRVVETGRAADFSYLAGLMREIRDFRPAIIHAHLLGSGVYGTIASVLTDGQPIVCTLHGRPDVPDPDRFRFLKARVLSRSNNRVAYVSEDLRQWAEPLLGIPHHLGEVVHNGIDFPDVVLRGTERAQCGAGAGELLVGSVGNVRPAKDYENLLKAAAIVCGSRDHVRFVIVGDDRTELTDGLRKLAKSLGIADRVKFLGFRDDVAALVHTFDVFVSSSRTEGLPLATVEAVASATPVVLTRVGGVPEVVEPGVTGRLVEPRSPTELATGILETLSDPVGSKRMAEAGALDVRERFTARRMCDAYQELYQRLIQPVDPA
jgi:glycosyltransferase involved in cell wall biosynthesis